MSEQSEQIVETTDPNLASALIVSGIPLLRLDRPATGPIRFLSSPSERFNTVRLQYFAGQLSVDARGVLEVARGLRAAIRMARGEQDTEMKRR